MISYEQALKFIAAEVDDLGIINLAIANCLGYVAAQDVICDCLISPFDNSAMDGFAVRYADLQSGIDEMDVVGSSFAGDSIAAGQQGAWEIMTGAGVPDGFDSVIKIEDISILDSDKDGQPLRIKINVDPKSIAFENNVRKAGQDFMPDDVVVEAGDVINAAHISAMATVGVAKINVRKKPLIAVISTGKEIIDDANAPLKSGQIRNSNGPSLIATLKQMGYEAEYTGTIADEIDDYENCLKSLVEKYDVIISTGAVSMGRHDFIPESLQKLGAEIIFHKCKIRPGKPILFAKFKQKNACYFGLPGNPVSANVGLRFFVNPLLDASQGLAPEAPIKAKLATDISKKHSFKMFYKAFAKLDNGQLSVDILQGQESFKIKPLLKANCLAVFDEDQHKTEQNALVNIYPMIANVQNF